MSTLLGLDLGASAMKLAVGDQSGVSQIASVLLPSDLIRDPEDGLGGGGGPGGQKRAAGAAHEKAPLRRGHPGGGAPSSARLTVPYMSPEQLRVNLPYEFHDFIQGDKDQYFYDYAVVSVIQGRKDDAAKRSRPPWTCWRRPPGRRPSPPIAGCCAWRG